MIETYTLFTAIAPSSLWSRTVFLLVCGWVVGSLCYALWCSTKFATYRVRIFVSGVIAIVFYLLAIGLLVRTEVFDRQFLPWGPLFMVGSVALPVALGLSRFGRQVVNVMPISYLAAFQIFRLPLEIVLFDWGQSNTVPLTMTWLGNNWDILTGIASLLAYAYADRSRRIAWAFNIMGIALLLNVIAVAVLSSPIPFGWNLQTPLELIVELPYAYIVPICVGGAALGHVLLTRMLLLEVSEHRAS